MYKVVLINFDEDRILLDSMEFSNLLEAETFKRGADMRLSLCEFEHDTEHHSVILEKYEKIDVEEFVYKKTLSSADDFEEEGITRLAQALDYDSDLGDRMKSMLREEE